MCFPTAAFSEGTAREKVANRIYFTVLHPTNVVLSNFSEIARTSVRESWPRRGYVLLVLFRVNGIERLYTDACHSSAPLDVRRRRSMSLRG